MNYILQGFGVFLGVIAGTAVTVLTSIVLARRQETQQMRNLRFELDANIRKIDTWIEELGRWRNAVNGDSLHTYFGYFDLNRLLSVTANAMYQSGLLYSKLSHDHIGKLQIIFSEFSLHGEQYINNQITQGRQALEKCRTDGELKAWSSRLKPEAVGTVNFWEKKFQEHRRALDEIARLLQ
jgi:hypothetical protein